MASGFLDPEAYAAVRRLGRSALAWEALRRDSAYCAAYRDWSHTSAMRSALAPALKASWGLHFP